MNREHMEQWIAALETYEGEPARYLLMDTEGRMCAMGIGLNAMMNGRLAAIPGYLEQAALRFPRWIGIDHPGDTLNLSLKPDGSGYDTVAKANDVALQSPWTIAQRLRETYLKEEGQ
jgi:hypothetical protein